MTVSQLTAIDVHTHVLASIRGGGGAGAPGGAKDLVNVLGTRTRES